MNNKDLFDNLPKYLLRTNAGESVEVSKEVNPQEIEQIWGMVQTGFTELNSHAYDKQDMTKEEFLADIESDSVLKYLAREKAGNLMGYLAVHIGLQNVMWAEVEKLKESQAQIDEDAIPFYITSLVVPVDKRSTTAATRILQGAITHFDEVNKESGHNSLCFFDCSDYNYPWLAEFIERTGNHSDDGFEEVPVEITEIYKKLYLKEADNEEGHSTDIVLPDAPENKNVLGSQHYYSMKIKTN